MHTSKRFAAMFPSPISLLLVLAVATQLLGGSKGELYQSDCDDYTLNCLCVLPVQFTKGDNFIQ